MDKDLLLAKRLVEDDPLLKPYESILLRRITRIRETEYRLTEGKKSLDEFAAT